MASENQHQKSETQHGLYDTGSFEKRWASSTEDNNITLYGFKRYKTAHLLNLRFLEEEIGRLDHQIYQAGLKLGIDPTPADRIGLKHCIKDEHALRADQLISEELIHKLRELLRQYGTYTVMTASFLANSHKDDGLAAFSRIMSMETCSMLDDERQTSLRSDISLFEIYNTRLVRVDLGPRTNQDPFQRRLHKYLRWFRYWRLKRDPAQDQERGGRSVYDDRSTRKWTYQNTVLVADTLWRIIVALAANIFVIAPLAILSYQSSKELQLVTISAWIIVFSVLIAVIFKASNQATVAVIAAYAAVLSVFISNRVS